MYEIDFIKGRIILTRRGEMVIKHRKKISPIRLLAIAIMLGLMVIALLPIVYLVSTAFKPTDELFRFPPKFLVERPTLRNFSDLAFSLEGFSVPFTRYTLNSIITTVSIVGGSLFISSMGAYALSKFKLKITGFVFSLIIAALMFSPQVTQIPTYLLIAKMGIIDTYLALILPKLAVAYNIFLMKQFIDQIPDTYLESARLDGAGELYIFWRIIMPMCKPAWSTLIVFSFVANWNDYFSPLVFTTTEQMKNLTLAIQTIGTSVERAGAMAAAAFIMTVPTVILFIFLQRKVMDTMMFSGIKG